MLLVRLQIALRLRLRAQTLNGVHGVLPLTEEGIAELLHPVDLFVQQAEDLREAAQRLHAVVPVVFLQLVVERLVLEVWLGFHEPGRLDDLERIRRRHQCLRHQRIRVERDRRHDLLELLRLE